MPWWFTIPLADRIVVGCETAPRLFRLLANGTQDVIFNPPQPTAAVLALEVDPFLPGFVPNPFADVYVGLNNGTIGGRLNFTRLLPTGTPDPGAFWNVLVPPPPFQTSVNGPVRAIKYSPNLFGIGVPGVVVGGTFTQATGGTSQNVGNIALFDTNGAVDTFFPTTGGAANGTVNALAVVPAVLPVFLTRFLLVVSFRSSIRWLVRGWRSSRLRGWIWLSTRTPTFREPFPTRCGRWC
jgi:hypothetical protein